MRGQESTYKLLLVDFFAVVDLQGVVLLNNAEVLGVVRQEQDDGADQHEEDVAVVEVAVWGEKRKEVDHANGNHKGRVDIVEESQVDAAYHHHYQLNCTDSDQIFRLKQVRLNISCDYAITEYDHIQDFVVLTSESLLHKGEEEQRQDYENASN